jgi:hypothetical protein
MKKLLLIGLILAICILAMPQGVLAATATPVVNANIAHTLVFTAPSPTQWILGRGAAATINLLSDTANGADPIPIGVDSANKWDLKAIDANAGGIEGHQAHMIPTSGFVPTYALPLENALEVQTGGWGGTPTFTALPESGNAPVIIRSAQPSGVVSFTEDLKQTVALADYVLTTGTYQMTITFTLNEL